MPRVLAVRLRFLIWRRVVLSVVLVAMSDTVIDISKFQVGKPPPDPDHASFNVEQIAPYRWIIRASFRSGRSTALLGVYSSKEAAEGRLPSVSRLWEASLSMTPRQQPTVPRAHQAAEIDPLSKATAWLDAYRDGDLERILVAYADEARVCCGCQSGALAIGRDAIRAYWQKRLHEEPSVQLFDLELASFGTVVSYAAPSGVVDVVLQFDLHGQIVSHLCAPRP